MKKILLMALAVMMLASCTKPGTTDLASDPPATRAINDIFKVERIGAGNFYMGANGKLDFQGNLYSPNSSLYYDTSKKQLFDFHFDKIYSLIPDDTFRVVDWCFDNKGNILVTGINYSDARGQVYMFTPDMNSMVDLTSYFPDDIYVFSICAAENGNIFLNVGDEKPSGYYYETQKIYRLNLNTGVVKEVVSGIQFSNGNFYSLMKMKGAFVGGNCDGRLFKANTNTGEVEYITPRFDSYNYMAASNMSNFYGVDSRLRIIELRPNMATDLVIGTIPSTYIDGDGNMAYIGDIFYLGSAVNADATAFYVGDCKFTLQ